MHTMRISTKESSIDNSKRLTAFRNCKIKNQNQIITQKQRKCKRKLRDVDTVLENTLPEAEQLGKESSKGEKGSFFPVETKGERTTNPSMSRSLFLPITSYFTY